MGLKRPSATTSHWSSSVTLQVWPLAAGTRVSLQLQEGFSTGIAAVGRDSPVGVAVADVLEGRRFGAPVRAGWISAMLLKMVTPPAFSRDDGSAHQPVLQAYTLMPPSMPPSR